MYTVIADKYLIRKDINTNVFNSNKVSGTYLWRMQYYPCKRKVNKYEQVVLGETKSQTVLEEKEKSYVYSSRKLAHDKIVPWTLNWWKDRNHIFLIRLQKVSFCSFIKKLCKMRKNLCSLCIFVFLVYLNKFLDDE